MAPNISLVGWQTEKCWSNVGIYKVRSPDPWGIVSTFNTGNSHMYV